MEVFIHYPKRPKNLTAKFAKNHYSKLVSQIELAENSPNGDLWIELFRQWNELKSYISSEGSRISHKYSKNMNDKLAEQAENYFREEVYPAIDSPEHQLTKAFIQSKHRPILEQTFGYLLTPTYKTALQPLNPVNTKLRIKAGELSKDYEKIMASAEVVVEGQKVTLTVARMSLSRSPSSITRQAAFKAVWDFILSQQSILADIYDQLVELRTEMGRNVGYKNYLPLGYENMGRTDYGTAETATFRANVRKYCVPLHKKLSLAQAKNLGTTSLKPWDLFFDPETVISLGVVPVNMQLDGAQNIFDKLSPNLGQHFKNMRTQDLIDLENRAGKRSGAYCTSFSDSQDKAVAILCNSVGDAEDISTLTHEMGHAFSGLENRHIEAVDLQWPTSDLCEVHSMGMEFLSSGYIEEFFSKSDAAKYQKNMWQESVYTLCYIAMVDDFQHWVYNFPDSDPSERDNKWRELSKIYLPGIDFSDCEQYRHTRWYAQAHIFSIPFYYIDYALALTGALQLGIMDKLDHNKTMKIYLDLCRIGGTKGILQAFADAGLRSPFEEELMKDLMDAVEKIS